MNKLELEKGLTRLGELLRERRVAGEIAVFGGAAIILGFDFREATQDIDALITQGHGQVVKAQEEVGKELGLPPNWINEQGTSYLSKHSDFSMFRTYPSEGQFGLRVLMATPRYLLAMKLLSFRSYGHDIQDIVELARRIGCTSEEGLLQVVKRYYPDEQVLPEEDRRNQKYHEVYRCAPRVLRKRPTVSSQGRTGWTRSVSFLTNFT